MEEDRTRELTNIVNASGFAFQMAVEHQIRRRIEERGGWELLPEHPWKNPQSGEAGFIDMILIGNAAKIVVECKRTQDATWVFLQPSREPRPTPLALCRWFEGTRDHGFITGADPLRVVPDSPETAFCTIRGSGETDRSLLERLGAKLIKSVDSLADEELQLSRMNVRVAGSQQVVRYYIPVIVTTARLVVCEFNPEIVSLTDGMLPGGEYRDVEIVRFRKTLSTEMLEGVEVRSIAEANRAKERTLLVVHASYLLRFLELFDVRGHAPFAPLPWVSRRSSGNRSIVGSGLD